MLRAARLVRFSHEESSFLRVIENLALKLVEVFLHGEKNELYAGHFLNSVFYFSKHGTRVERDHDILPAWMTGLVTEEAPSDRQYGGWIITELSIIVAPDALNRDFRGR